MGRKKRAARCGIPEPLCFGLCRGTHNDRIATIHNVNYCRAARRPKVCFLVPSSIIPDETSP
jgi:hypothetical protein